MIALLRRQRWLAALLVLASPAIGGQAMPMVSPCAAQGGAMPMAMAGPMQSMPGHQQTPPGNQQQHCCDCCMACCHSMPASISTRPSVTVRIAAVPRYVDWPVIEHAAHAASTLDRLPESTAPPLG